MANIFGIDWWKNRFSVEKNADGTYAYWEKGGTSYTKVTTDKQKLQIVLSSPAMLKVIALQCDLFSLGEVNVIENDKVLDTDPLYNLLNNPNPFQTRRQILWDYMFWNMLGKAIGYSTTKTLNDTTRFYWLNMPNVSIPTKLKEKMGYYFAGKKDYNDLLNETIEYTYPDLTTKKFKLSEIKFFADLTNGLGNWFDGPSRIDALYKVISNSEHALDAKNINLRFSGKFMVGGDKKANDMYADMMPMGKDEQKSVEDTVGSKKEVTAVRAMIDIKRFVEDMRKLELDQAYEHDYFIIGSMYSIPKEILDIYLRDSNGISDSNKEKAIGRHVGYSLQPKADDLCAGLCTFFGYDKEKKSLTITYDHLPFMQVLEKEKAETQELKAKSLEKMIKAGATPETAAKFLGIEVEFKKVEDGSTNNEID